MLTRLQNLCVGTQDMVQPPRWLLLGYANLNGMTSYSKKDQAYVPYTKFVGELGHMLKIRQH